MLAPLDVGKPAPEGRPVGRPGPDRPPTMSPILRRLLESSSREHRAALHLASAGMPEAQRRAFTIQTARPLLGRPRLPESWSRTVFFRAGHQSVTPPERRSHPVTPSRVTPRTASLNFRAAGAGRRRRPRSGGRDACGGGRSWSRSALASPGRYTLPAAIIGTV
jgi:hypothetical protein